MLKAFLEENFSDKNLIVVSNREPYIHKKTGLSIRVEKSAGGLTSAMDDVLRVTGGIWVAWGSGSGDRDVVDSKNCVLVPPENPSYMLKRVWLTPSEVENYYHGYSNQVLWPLCHITLDRVYFRKRFWKDYKKANRHFTRAVLEEANKDSIIWIHDYHLCLVPRMLRNEMPELTIAHFWHIPWPDWSVFRVCPQAKEIIEGLLGNDLIGFQIPLFVKNFMDCVWECIDADVDYNRAAVVYKGHSTRLRTFPISIDYDGTLTPIVETPDKAVITDEMRSLLIKLKEYIPIAVISGRTIKDIKARVGIEDIIYAGNHGAEIWDGKKVIISQGSAESRRLLEEVLERLRKELSYVKGVLIEDKGITASLHFRNVNMHQVGDVFSIFGRIADEYKDDFRFITGKKVFEIRPANIWNKGDAVLWIIENMGEGRFPVYIGDDATDEDTFIALKNRGLSIGGSTNADYYIQSQGEVKDFLTMLTIL